MPVGVVPGKDWIEALVELDLRPDRMQTASRPFRPLERLHIRLPVRDHVAHPVSVEPHRPYHIAFTEEHFCLHNSLRGEDLVEPVNGPNITRRQWTGLCCEKADGERL